MVFLASYQASEFDSSRFFLGDHGVVMHRRNEVFTESVRSISPRFVTIYNQARTAEENGLSEVAGCGFRRSIEFLVKDYLLFDNKDSGADEEGVKTAHLADCIKKIDDERVRAIARKATWLGNDETHYLRKFEDFDLQNLKELIKLTAYWIDAKETAKKYDQDLPSK
ncbi:MAG: DUF4145 domain-containing protein [candidate division Zixibacteria bacterium]|nr:DUF4145 domain-containing protein [candidate division Zixibacteria bacterium]